MRKYLALCTLGFALAVVGCQDNNSTKNDDMQMKSTEPKKMSTDACSHCPGNQTMTAEGKCSSCGMKL